MFLLSNPPPPPYELSYAVDSYIYDILLVILTYSANENRLGAFLFKYLIAFNGLAIAHNCCVGLFVNDTKLMLAPRRFDT